MYVLPVICSVADHRRFTCTLFSLLFKDIFHYNMSLFNTTFWHLLWSVVCAGKVFSVMLCDLMQVTVLSLTLHHIAFIGRDHRSQEMSKCGKNSDTMVLNLLLSQVLRVDPVCHMWGSTNSHSLALQQLPGFHQICPWRRPSAAAHTRETHYHNST